MAEGWLKRGMNITREEAIETATLLSNLVLEDDPEEQV